MQKHYSKHAKGGNSPTETYLQSCSTYAHSTWFSFVLCYRKQNLHFHVVKLSSKGHYHLHFLYSVVFSFPIPLLGQTAAPVRCLSGQTPRCSYCSLLHSSTINMFYNTHISDLCLRAWPLLTIKCIILTQ